MILLIHIFRVKISCIDSRVFWCINSNNFIRYWFKLFILKSTGKKFFILNSIKKMFNFKKYLSVTIVNKRVLSKCNWFWNSSAILNKKSITGNPVFSNSSHKFKNRNFFFITGLEITFLTRFFLSFLLILFSRNK